jgi:hypothetical protein
MLAVLLALWNTRRTWGAAERTVALMLLSVGWILAMVLLVDGSEGNRIRFSTEPFFFAGGAWALGVFLRSRREKGAERSGPSDGANV